MEQCRRLLPRDPSRTSSGKTHAFFSGSAFWTMRIFTLIFTESDRLRPKLDRAESDAFGTPFFNQSVCLALWSPSTTYSQNILSEERATGEFLTIDPIRLPDLSARSWDSTLAEPVRQSLLEPYWYHPLHSPARSLLAWVCASRHPFWTWSQLNGPNAPESLSLEAIMAEMFATECLEDCHTPLPLPKQGLRAPNNAKKTARRSSALLLYWSHPKFNLGPLWRPSYWPPLSVFYGFPQPESTVFAEM